MRYNNNEQKFVKGEAMKKRIDLVLMEKGYFSSRQKAKYAIEKGTVLVNGKIIEKVSKEIEEKDNIEIQGEALPFVSRGGLKLAKAIKHFALHLKDKIVMDIGASTGGFTDCMLQKGAKKVYAIDVGRDQLVEKLKNNSKVINLENTNVKDLKKEQFEKISFISVDVSFISLEQVLPKIAELLEEKGQAVVLVKPQFEAGKENINKNGVVKQPKIHQKVIEKIILLANDLKLKVKEIEYSPIKGPAGNIEYLLLLEKVEQKPKLDLFLIRQKVKDIVEKSHRELG